MLPVKFLRRHGLILTGILLATLWNISSAEESAPSVSKKLMPESSAAQAEEEFDRLDGRGSSGKRVDVIEWEGNLEIHVYPKGSLAGLALKLDKTNNKIVMVIGYRFTNNPKKQLIRRAIIGVPFTEQFKAFQATKEPDFDKIVISNNGLSGDLAEYKLDPAPTQLYPEDPTKTAAKKSALAVNPQEQRTPSGELPTANPVKNPTEHEELGTIRPFQW